MSTTKTTSRATERRTPALGDGDRDDDWAPPRTPSKPTLTICMDTRRRAGQRGARVSVSTAAHARAPLHEPMAPPKPAVPGAHQPKVPRRSAWATVSPPVASPIVSPVVSPAVPPTEAGAPKKVKPETVAADTQKDDTAADHDGGASRLDAPDQEAHEAPGPTGRDGDPDNASGENSASASDVDRSGLDEPRTEADLLREPLPRGAWPLVGRVQSRRRDALVVVDAQKRDQLARRIIAVLVGRPYGVTIPEVVVLAEEVLGARCTQHDARLLVGDLPRDLVVVRRMITPWFVPRTAVALETRFALDHVVAPAVARVLRQRGSGSGIDVRRLDVAVLTHTGMSLRMHAINYANGSTRGMLGMLPGVVGRIENIATRAVVYPAGHMRALALFAPLDADRSDADGAQGEGAGVSRAARCAVTLVTTVAAAAAACAHATDVGMASSAPVVVDCRGIIDGRHARGPPIGMLQIGVPGDGSVYQLDMVALHADWFADSAHGHAGGSSDLFAALGITALLGDPRVVKAVFDSRPTAQVFWRRASCVMANVFDLRRACRSLTHLSLSLSFSFACALSFFSPLFLYGWVEFLTLA